MAKTTKNEKQCKNCKAKCCKEIAVSIKTPKTEKDWDEIRWLVAHKNVQVYKDLENDWLVEFFTSCEQLNKKNKCKIYEKRPLTCKKHQSKDCIITGPNDYYKILFKNLEEVEKYLKKKKNKKINIKNKKTNYQKKQINKITYLKNQTKKQII
jgi:uncharacterized protein